MRKVLGGIFFGKRGNKFQRFMWGFFVVSVTVIAGFCAILVICIAYNVLYNKYRADNGCKDPYCYHTQYVGRQLYFHNHEDGKGYVYNPITGEKVLKHVAWIAKPTTKNDSLVCFSDGKKRGYFSRNTGKVIIKPKYNHAWVFSDGLACVEEDGLVKFIDGTGKVVIDKKMIYNPRLEGYVFHGGYCIIYTDNGELCGLMDKTGKMVLPMEYDRIYIANNFEHWCVKKGKKMALLDKDLKIVMPFAEWSINMHEETVTITMPNHTIREYDLQGNLINDFYISNVRMLEYEKDEILYRCETYDEEGNKYTTPILESYHPSATARLRAYGAGDGYEGLTTADGNIVTMPLYIDIDAIGYDLYLCTTTNNNKVVVNGKGEIVK